MPGMSRTVWGNVGVTVDTASMVTGISRRRRVAGELQTGEHQGRPAVGGGADLQQPQRVGHHRGGQHLLGGDRLAVTGVRVLEPGPGVLDLDGGEVGLGGPEQLHAAAGVEGEVGGVGGPDQVEAQPVRVVLALAPHRLEEALGGGVGPDHQGHVAQPGQDLGPGVGDGLGPRGTGGVGRGDPGPGPPEGLGEGGPGDEAGVAVADGVGPGHVLDVGPLDAGFGQGVAGGGQPVLDEVAAPLAPGVHAGPEHGHPLVVSHRPAPSRRARRRGGPGADGASGRHFHTMYSCSSSS